MTPSHDTQDRNRSALPDNRSTLDPRQSAARAAMRRCWMLTAGMIAVTGVGLASCVPSAPVPTSAPAPTPTQTASTEPARPAVVQAPTDWRDAPITPGDWHYVADGNATRALFGTMPSTAVFTVACEKANRQVKLWRAGGTVPASIMTITTTESVRSISAQASAGASPQIYATLAPYDPTLDAMVFSRGRFAVQVPGTDTLYVPSWPEIARVVEDCR